MTKFKLDSKKKSNSRVKNTILAVDSDSYRWVKTVAAVNETSISNAFNQIIEFAKKNSERISI